MAFDSHNTQQSAKRKRRNMWMFDFIFSAVEKVFPVPEGEPVRIPRLNSRENILEEEVLFCKNNVCVHEVTNVNVDDVESFGEEKHLPGYLNMKKIYRADSHVSDLILNWTPNSLMTIGSAEEGELLMSSSGEDLCSASNASNSMFESMNCSNASSSFDGNCSPKLDDSLCVQDFDTPLGNVFSINLIDAKTIKIFYSNTEKDVGQFVICSKENEYKVFHFHNVGLVKLTEIFDLWNGCERCEDLNAEEDGQQVYFISGCEDAEIGVVGASSAHPEEGRYKPMNMSRWLSGINHLGQIEDGFNFRKHVFFAGLSQEVRPDAWKYLLYHYPMHSTRKDREVIKEQKKKLYESIQEKRLALSGEEYENFWRKTQFTVDKDVVRTDRSHPYYAGQQNPNLDKMRNVLLNYAHYNPDIGYTQGMSDLLAPLLVTLHDESDSFWCFVGLMEFSMFATTPTDKSMDKSLGFLRELLRMMTPEFYMHCLCNDEDLNLLFAHRWLVLCFKREFIFHEVLRIWETCWARYQTDYFHIFICVAIVSLYGTVCMEKKMDSVEILQYFTDMAMKFDGSAILTEARSLLYKFRQLNRLPCSLRGLLSGKGVWDGGITPEIECVSRHKNCCQDFVRNTNGTQRPSLVAASTSTTTTTVDTASPSREPVKEATTVTDASASAALKTVDTAPPSREPVKEAATVTEASASAALDTVDTAVSSQEPIKETSAATEASGSTASITVDTAVPSQELGKETSVATEASISLHVNEAKVEEEAGEEEVTEVLNAQVTSKEQHDLEVPGEDVDAATNNKGREESVGVEVEVVEDGCFDTDKKLKEELASVLIVNGTVQEDVDVLPQQQDGDHHEKLEEHGQEDHCKGELIDEHQEELKQQAHEKSLEGLSAGEAEDQGEHEVTSEQQNTETTEPHNELHDEVTI